jgi:hypothetical protein
VKKQQTLSRRIRAPRCQWFNLDWILSFFVSLDDQIARISRMKASTFFVIRAPAEEMAAKIETMVSPILFGASQ